MQVETKFIAKDGKKFDTEADALAHEIELNRKAKERYEKYLMTYRGKRLLEQHSSDEYGVWKVVSETDDPGPGGGRGTDMGLVEGRFEDVLRWATAQNGFWSWGSGGEIRKVDIKKI